MHVQAIEAGCPYDILFFRLNTLCIVVRNKQHNYVELLHVTLYYICVSKSLRGPLKTHCNLKLKVLL